MTTNEIAKVRRSKILFESRVKMGELLDTETGDALQRPRETCEGSRGTPGPTKKPVLLIVAKGKE
jgi:hypothetical protein